MFKAFIGMFDSLADMLLGRSLLRHSHYPEELIQLLDAHSFTVLKMTGDANDSVLWEIQGFARLVLAPATPWTQITLRRMRRGDMPYTLSFRAFYGTQVTLHAATLVDIVTMLKHMLAYQLKAWQDFSDLDSYITSVP